MAGTQLRGSNEAYTTILKAMTSGRGDKIVKAVNKSAKATGKAVGAALSNSLPGMMATAVGAALTTQPNV